MKFAGLYAPNARIGGGLDRDRASSGMPYREISAPQGPQAQSGININFNEITCITGRLSRRRSTMHLIGPPPPPPTEQALS